MAGLKEVAGVAGEEEEEGTGALDRPQAAAWEGTAVTSRGAATAAPARAPVTRRAAVEAVTAIAEGQAPVKLGSNSPKKFAIHRVIVLLQAVARVILVIPQAVAVEATAQAQVDLKRICNVRGFNL